MTGSVRPLAVALGGCCALAAAMGIGRFVYTPILPAMMEGLGLATSQAGLIASANFLGYLIGAVSAGSSRITAPPRTVLLATLAVSAATTAAMGLVESFPWFLLLRFVGGAASACGLVFASSLVLERLAGTGREGLASVHFAGVGTGVVLSAGLVPLIGSGGADWPALWLGAGALAVAGSVGAALLIPPARRGTAPPPVEGPHRVPFAFVAAYALLGFGYVVTATFIVAMVRETPGLRALETPVWLAFGLAAAPSVALWSWAGKRFGVLRTYAAAALVQAAGVVAGVVGSSASGLFVSAVLLGGTFMGMTALGFAAARTLSPEAPRKAVAVMTAAFGFGQMIGPSVAGYGHDLTGGFLWPSLLAAAGLVLSAVMTMRVVRRGG